MTFRDMGANQSARKALFTGWYMLISGQLRNSCSFMMGHTQPERDSGSSGNMQTYAELMECHSGKDE